MYKTHPEKTLYSIQAKFLQIKDVTPTGNRFT